MSMTDWAKREVEIACKLENPNRKEGEWDYGCACYESALKAFNCLMEDGHSGFSIGLTKNILNRLIDGKCLTPIEDTDDIWEYSFDKNGEKMYQCTRMSSLFKTVQPDGSVSYSDINRCYGVNVHNPNVSWSSGLIDRVIDEMFPITMPYLPESKSFCVYCEELLTDSKNGDYDTVGSLHAIKPDGKCVVINRFFKEGDESFIEITSWEFGIRMKMHQERLEKLKKEQENE